MRRSTFIKTIFIVIAITFGSVNVWGQVNITPIRTDVSGFSNWTDVNITGTTYLQLLTGTSSTISPAMDFSTYTNETLNFKARTYGGGNTTENEVFVAISIDGGSSWVDLGSRIPTTTTLTAMSSFDLSSYDGENIKIKFYVKGTSNSIGAGIDDISITGIFVPNCTASNLAFTNSTIDKVVGDAAFTEISTSLNTVTPVTYSSSDVNIAAVDANTGEVTLVGVGVATITATQAAGTVNAVDYCEATAAYTLNVTRYIPTITVTEVPVTDFTAYVGNTDVENIPVSGINLTDNVTISLSGNNANQFNLSQTSVAQTNGTAPETVVVVSYVPTDAGSHTATLTVSSAGAPDVTRALTGTAEYVPLDTPVATDASGITYNGFTANWNEVQGATECQLDVYSMSGGNVPDLIISEYVEGSSNNKAIEIYNGTGRTVDLSRYSLKKQSNGVGSYASELILSGTLSNNSVYIMANTYANSSILALADNTNNSTASFNGNDAIGLFKNGVQIDEVGVYNQVTYWGVDKTLVRKNSVSSPLVPFDLNEWLQFGIDDIDSLGSHTMTNAKAQIPVTGSPFTVTDATSKLISGLEPETQYYYTVTAKNAHVTSSMSNEVSVVTTISTGLQQAGNISISAENGKIRFNANANQTVEIYNAIGQKLFSKQTVEGMNTVSVNAHGVILVKVGSQISKVVL